VTRIVAATTSDYSAVGSGCVHVRLAELADIDGILLLHREAFADKFGGAFGVHNTERGAEALATAWRRQGTRALRGMLVAETDQRIIGTTTLRTSESGLDDSGAAEIAFQQVLGFWGTLRSLFALSLLDHRIGRDEGFITDVAVLAPYRRRGVARRLMERAEDLAIYRRKRYLGLYVSAANTGAHQLYRQFQFYDVRLRKSWLMRWVFGQRAWIYMRKDLHLPDYPVAG
jgi:ribosomal protein S18 acetylase RimI-like enzyme